jgi:hypothetical protein
MALVAQDDFSIPDSISDGYSSGPRAIKGSEKGRAIGGWIGVLLFGGIGFGFLFWQHMPLIVPIGHGFPNPFYLFFALPVIVLLTRAILDTSRVVRFGDPVFEPGAGPFVLGGTLDGRLNLNAKAAAIGEFKITLACIQRIVTPGAKSDHVTEKILWKSETTVRVLPGGILPIALEIPAHQPATAQLDLRNSILWRLTVRAASGHFTFLETYGIVVRPKSTATR